MVIERLVAWQDVVSLIDQKSSGGYLDGVEVEYISPLTGLQATLTYHVRSKADINCIQEQVPAMIGPARAFQILERESVKYADQTRNIVKIRVLYSPS